MKWNLLKIPARIVALLLVGVGSLQLYGSLTVNAFLGNCGADIVAATGNCRVYLSPHASAIVSVLAILIGGAILSGWVAQRRWWPYIAVALTFVIAGVATIAKRTCTASCGFAGPNDLGGCPVVQTCTYSTPMYVVWLLPLAAIAYLIIRRLMALKRDEAGK